MPWLLEQWFRNTNGHIPLGCFLLGLIIFTLYHSQQNKTKISVYIVWFILSLPIIPYLGSTFGMLNRLLYAHLLSFLFGSELKGTSLYNGDYGFHIDGTCSGIQGFYLFSILWILKSLAQKNPPSWKNLGYLLGTFWVLNTVRVAGLFYLHNVQHITDLNTWDLLWGTFNIAFPLWILILRSQRTA